MALLPSSSSALIPKFMSWLEKETSKVPAFSKEKKFKKRFVVLRGGRLEMYKNPKRINPNKHLKKKPLVLTTKWRILDINNYRGKKNAFGIVQPDGVTTHWFLASSEQERQDWLKHIRNVVSPPEMPNRIPERVIEAIQQGKDTAFVLSMIEEKKLLITAVVINKKEEQEELIDALDELEEDSDDESDEEGDHQHQEGTSPENAAPASAQKEEEEEFPLEVEGDSMLHLAIKHERFEFLKSLLLKEGVNVNIANSLDETPLHYACSRGLESVVKDLISKGATVGKMNNQGLNPLMVAIKSKKHAVTEMLLDISDVDLSTVVAETGDTALHLAMVDARAKVVRAFVKRIKATNAQSVFDLRNKEGFSATDICLRNGKLIGAKYLAQNGAKPTAEGTTPLMREISAQYLPIVVELGDVESFRKIYQEAKPDVNKIDVLTGHAPLHATILHEQNEMVTFLLEQPDIDVNIKVQLPQKISSSKSVEDNEEKEQPAQQESSSTDTKSPRGTSMNRKEKVTSEVYDLFSYTPLMLACMKLNKQVAKHLILKSADVNARADNSGMTAFLHACRLGDLELVELLLDNGCDIFQTDNQGLTCLHFAASGGHLSIVRVLIEKGLSVNQCSFKGLTPLSSACERGRGEVILFLVDQGADIMGSGKEEYPALPPLHNAVKSGNVNLVEFLLKKGVPLNQQASNIEDADGRHLYQALHIACIHGMAHLVKWLIENGADRHVKISHGVQQDITLLHVAAESGFEDVVEQLLKKGLDINARTSKGTTPLYVAIHSRQFDMVKTLREYGAKSDEASLQLAITLGSVKVLQLLADDDEE